MRGEQKPSRAMSTSGSGAAAHTPKRLPHHGRGAGFTRKEVGAMLRVVREMLPVSSEDWNDVHRAHSATYCEVARTADSLRRKFLALCRATAGSSASYSSEVREAKRIRRFMLQRAEVVDGGTGSSAAMLAAFGDEESDSNALASDPASMEGVYAPTNTDIEKNDHPSVVTRTESSTDNAYPPTDAAATATPRPRHRRQRSATNSDVAESNAATWTTTAASADGARTPINYVADQASSLPIAPIASAASTTNIVELLKMQILAGHEAERRRRDADELWRQEVRERRAEERRERELERQGERKWREDVARRHEQLLEAIMLLIANKS